MFGLNVLPIPATDVITYMNIAFIGIIVLGAIIGFFRGTLKSTYFAIMTLLIFVGGWLLMGPISRGLINSDLGWTHITYEGIALHKPLEFVHEIINTNYPEYAYLLEEGTYSLELIKGIIDIVFKIIYTLGLILIAFTLYYIISGVVWMIVKKPLKKLFSHAKTTKNGKKKYKVGILSRLGGVGIGAVKGLMYTLLIGFIFAGLASVSDSITQIANTENEEAVVVCTGDAFTVVKLADEGNPDPAPTNPDENTAPGIFSEYQDVLDVLSGYRKTIAGKVFGMIKYGENGTTFDEYVFDTIFSVKVGKTNVKLRNELRTVARAFSTDAVKQIMTDGFDITKLAELPDEDLTALIDTLSELKVITLVVPVGIEFIAYSNQLDAMLGADAQKVKELLQSNLKEFVEADYCQDVKHLGYAFVDVLDLLGENINDLSKVDFLHLDVNTVNQIFDELNNVNLLTAVAPITIHYLVNNEVVVNALRDAGFTVDDLGLKDADGNLRLSLEQYKNEFINLKDVYKAVSELGIEIVDGKIGMDNLDPNKVAPFTEAIFNSIIISNAMPVVAETLMNNIPDPDLKLIFQDTNFEEINWKDEFTPLLTAVASILKTGVLDSTKDPIEIIQTKMTVDDFNNLGDYLSQSVLLTSHLDKLLDLLMGKLNLGITFVGLDKENGEVWDKTQLQSVLVSLKKIVDTGIITAADPVAAFKAVSMESLNSLAESISGSLYFTKNFNGVITFAMDGLNLGVSLEVLDKTQGENWDYLEISSVLGSVKTIVDTGLLEAVNPLDVVKTLDDNTYESLSSSMSSSNFMKKNLSNLLNVFTGSMEFPLASLNKEEWTNNEIYSVLKSVGIIASATTGENIEIETLLNLSDGELTTLLESKLLTQTLINVLVEQSAPGQNLEILKGIYADGTDTNGNKLYTWVDDKLPTNVKVEATGILNITPVIEATKYIIYKNGRIFTTCNTNILDLKTIEGYEFNENDEFSVKAVVEEGELRKAFNAITCLNLTDISTGVNIDLRDVVKEKNTLFASYILSETLIDQIRALDNDNPSGILEISTEFKAGGSGEWRGDEGELNSILNALDMVLGISTSTTPVLIDQINLENIDLQNIINEKATLFKSNVLTDTMIVELRKVDALTFPTEYLSEDLTIWKDNSGNNGELTYIFDALGNVVDLSMGLNGITPENIDINSIYKAKDIILKSAVLTATIVTQITNQKDIIHIPTEYIVPVNASYETDYALWKNTYLNGVIKTHGELDNLLNSLAVILGLGGDVKVPVTSITPETINLNKIVNDKEKVFESEILTATAVMEIQKLGQGPTKTIEIPEQFLGDYKVWKPDQTNELNKLLDSIVTVLPTLPTSGFNIDPNGISLKKIGDNTDKVFASEIITSTVVNELQKLTSSPDSPIILPKEYRGSYKVWQDSEELVNLFASLSSVITLPETGFNINTENIDLNNIFTNRDEILKSAVLSATIVDKITKLNTVLTIPENYKVNANQSWETDYDLWKNEYVNGAVVKRGELNNILGAINLVAGPDTSINNFSSLQFEKIFETNPVHGIVPQDEILKSAVISETIINTLSTASGSGSIPVSIPNMNNLTNPLDRSGWYNEYDVNGKLVSQHELANLINSINLVLGPRTNFEGVEIFESLDKMLEKCQDENYMNVLLKSLVLCETIRTNLTTITAIQTGNYVNGAFEKNFGPGYNVDDLSVWYGLDELTGLPQHLELWNLLFGSSLVLKNPTDPTKSLNIMDIGAFSIDFVLANENLVPKVNPMTLEVEESNIKVMLNSMIVENIFADLAGKLYKSTLHQVINEPVGGFVWYKADAIANGDGIYDLQSFLESYYLIQRHVNFSDIAGSITTLQSLGDESHDNELSELATGMVISRVFRGSIEKLFNTIFNFDGAYDYLYNLSVVQGTGMKPWASVKFVQADYDEPKTKKEAHDKFMVSYKAICAELAKVTI